MLERSEHKKLVDRLNTEWRVAGQPGASVRRNFVYRVRSLLGRLLLGPQETFNAAVVEYINTDVRLADAADELVRYRESLAARERRIEATARHIVAAHDEIRASIGLLQQATKALKRDIARLSDSSAGAQQPASASSSDAVPFADSLDSHTYLAFEDQFRGAPEEIRARLADYVPLFAGASDVLDIGCGRGEFLELLREQGITARGVDVNRTMVQACQERGFDATEDDALRYIARQPERSLGGVFAAQVVEHFEPAYLIRFLDAAFDALRPGASIVLETINPACWYAFFSSYIRDITHAQPVHPDTLQFLLVAAGFQRVEIRYRTPYPEQHKLQPVPSRPDLAAWADTLNENADKINRLLFTHLDYAAIGQRP
jgi:2-polyprenyl-3-methyl-5-hydroxy-6-metoxy-1,4-benzoquinol methylase